MQRKRNRLLAFSSLLLAPLAPLANAAPYAPTQAAELAVLGMASPGSAGLPRLDVVGGPFVGQTFALQVSQARPHAFGVLVLASESLPRILEIGGGSVTFFPSFLGEWIPFTTSRLGRSPAFVAGLPVSPSSIGLPFVAQAAIVDREGTGGWAFTPALQGRIGAKPAGSVFPGRIYAESGEVDALAAEDFDGDGIDDLAIVAGSAGIRLGNGDGTFGPRVPLVGTGGFNEAIELGDLDGDGVLDLVLAGDSKNQIPVFLGRGDGTFDAGVFVAAPEVGGIGLGDLDGDGLPDLAATSEERQSLEVFRNDGSGGFSPSFAVDPGESPGAVVIGDLTGDGLADVVTCRSPLGGAPRVLVYSGNGDGTLAGPMTLSVPGEVFDLALGDVDADGDLDILAAVSISRLVVFLAEGGGTFQRRGGPLGSYPQAIVAHDVNGDGFLDVSSADRGGTLTITLGQGDGRFATAKSIRCFDQPSDVAVGDWHGDGILDWAVAGENDKGIAIYPADETGLAVTGLSGQFGGKAVHASVADFDGDQLADLAVAGGESVAVAVGDGAGGFLPMDVHSFGTTTDGGLVAGDFDDDGAIDLAVSLLLAEEVRLLLGQGDGTFAPGTSLSLSSPPGLLMAGDFDGDGRLDLVVDDFSTSRVSLFLGTGDGGFASEISVPLPSAVQSIAVADVGLDGTLDLLAAGGPLYVLSWAAGSLEVKQTIPSVGGHWDLLVADLDRDGFPDVAAVSTQRINVLSGAGDGRFVQVQEIGVPSGRDLASGDFDADGHVDLALTGPLSGNVIFRLFRGRGDGTFESGVPFVGRDHVTAVAGDFVRDGLEDLLLGYPGVVCYGNQALNRSARTAAAAARAAKNSGGSARTPRELGNR